MNMHVRTPERAQDSLPEGLLAQERAREKALKKLRKLRTKAEAEVERLLAFLDAVDGYATTELEVAVDDEPCDDDELEGNLTGLHGQHLPSQFHDPAGDLEADGSDDEPSLGSINSSYGGGSQDVWASGAGGDLEDGGLGHDDREHDPLDVGEVDDSNDEPSLGWTVDGIAGSSTGDDREAQYHPTMDVDKTRKERRRGKRKVRSIEMAPTFVGPKRVRNLTKRQYALVKPRMDYGLPGFQSPTPNTTGLR